MWLIDPDMVGRAAYRRMAREGVIVAMLPGVARAPDIKETPGLRAAAVARHARAGMTVTGLAALWVHLGGTPPVSIDLVARDHAHPRSWEPVLPTRIHAGTRRPDTPLAPPAVALIDALRWDDLCRALPVAYRLLGSGAVRRADAVAALDAVPTRDRTSKRAWSAWGALCASHGVPIRAA